MRARRLPEEVQRFVVTEKKIEIKQTVFFDFNKATIKTVSFPLLNEVAQALKDNPKIKVEVQGHTDCRQRRLQPEAVARSAPRACATYLIKQGVAADRMDPKGYGENVPIADNRTADGRAQNRRVEFVITDR